MGMAASQARFLGLTARQNNVEYEGQQINQQRTLLSNESANYYNDLLGMTVPTPPSVDAYTKTMYTFSDGALTNTVTSMIAQSNGMYTVSYLSKWQDDYSVVSAASSVATQLTPKPNDTYAIGAAPLRALGQLPAGATPRVGNTVTLSDGTYTVQQDAQGYHVEKTKRSDTATMEPCTAADVSNFEYYYATDLTNFSDLQQVFKNSDGTFSDADGNVTSFTEDDLIISLYNQNESDPTYAVSLVQKNEAGTGYEKQVYRDVTEKQYLTDDEVASITTTDSITGTEFEGLSQAQINNMLKEERAWAELLKQKYGDTDWLVRHVTDATTGTKKPYFYSKNNLGAAIYDDKTKASLSAINCYTIGSEQKISEFKGVENCKVEKDSSGRLIALSIPKFNDDGSVTYVEYALTTETATDQAAYNDAMNQYEYDKYLYDQAVENINSKIEIIQAEDKNLELRLKQLDTEQKAIQTEKEAVSKVIEKNTQDTFKTFSA